MWITCLETTQQPPLSSSFPNKFYCPIIDSMILVHVPKAVTMTKIDCELEGCWDIISVGCKACSYSHWAVITLSCNNDIFRCHVNTILTMSSINLIWSRRCKHFSQWWWCVHVSNWRQEAYRHLLTSVQWTHLNPHSMITIPLLAFHYCTT